MDEAGGTMHHDGGEDAGLYDDLFAAGPAAPDTYLQNKVQELEEVLAERQADIHALQGQLDEQSQQLEAVTKERDALLRNISTLYNTAKAELARKQAEINALRAQQHPGQRGSTPPLAALPDPPAPASAAPVLGAGHAQRASHLQLPPRPPAHVPPPRPPPGGPPPPAAPAPAAVAAPQDPLLQPRRESAHQQHHQQHHQQQHQHQQQQHHQHQPQQQQQHSSSNGHRHTPLPSCQQDLPRGRDARQGPELAGRPGAESDPRVRQPEDEPRSKRRRGSDDDSCDGGGNDAKWRSERSEHRNSHLRAGGSDSQHQSRRDADARRRCDESRGGASGHDAKRCSGSDDDHRQQNRTSSDGHHQSRRDADSRRNDVQRGGQNGTHSAGGSHSSRSAPGGREGQR